MRHRLFTLLAALSLLALAGCNSKTTVHGDAVFKRAPLLSIGVVPDRLTLPTIPLDRVASYRFTVRELPYSLYPVWLQTAEFPRTESGEPLFPRCVLRVSIRSPEGTEVLAGTIHGSAKGYYQQLELDERYARDRSHLPDLVSYDVLVEVREPADVRSSGYLEGSNF